MANEKDENGNIDTIAIKICGDMERNLLPLVEDVAEWLSSYMQIKITTDNFLDLLDDGLIVCRLAEKIQKHSEDFVNGVKVKGLNRGVRKILTKLPKIDFHCHENAKRGSFFARENAAWFISWCNKIGIKETTLFESEGLVLQRQLRNVVLTLLELARIASNYEVDPIPSLIKLEKEIDEEEREPKQNITIRKKRKDSKVTGLDLKVQKCALKNEISVDKLQDGKYLVNKKTTVFVRVLNNHVMVRVGGGWDELDHFLSRHKPEKIIKILTSIPVTCCR